MNWEFVLEKMVEMVEGDWREKAKKLLEERIRDGGQVSFILSLKAEKIWSLMMEIDFCSIGLLRSIGIFSITVWFC